MHHVLHHCLRPALLLFCLGFGCSVAFAQSEEVDSSDLEQIEAEIGKSAPVQRPEAAPSSRSTLQDPQTLSDLGKLAPFSDVSVLQRRFMPKTERFQFNLGLGGIMNDPWFNGLGGSVRLGYHLNETWGVEGTYTFLSNSEKDSAKDLLANNTVSTASIVSTKGYMGLDAIWSPIYGKMSLFNKRIVPFDLYFTGGVGQSQVEGSTAASAMSYHLGTGQIYALSKSWGFRWDFSYNTFSATSSVTKSTQQFNNMILTLGVSFFFPEAKYR